MIFFCYVSLKGSEVKEMGIYSKNGMGWGVIFCFENEVGLRTDWSDRETCFL